MNDSTSTIRPEKNSFKIKEWMILFGVLVISFAAHSINLFHYPYFESDEGTYMSQAWAVLNLGKLAPYNYWYDHAPLGWIFIAGWVALTGGFHTFGFSINTGRVFMVVLHLLSTVFLYLISRKLLKNKLASFSTILLFTLSPLGIYYQRRVLLDNIMVFWLLFSLLLIVYNNNKTIKIILSSLSFGISVLSKETAIFFLPVYMYSLYIFTDPEIAISDLSSNNSSRKIKNTLFWTLLTFAVISIYPLYALFRGELFAVPGKVSLLSALQYQLSRGKISILDFQNSYFWIYFREWIKSDPFLIITGVVTSVINLIVGIKNKSARLISFFSVTMWIFLMRGDLVFEFYILPLIPFLAINIAFTADTIYELLSKKRHKFIYKYLPYLYILMIVLIGQIYYARHSKYIYSLYTSEQTAGQIMAVEYLKQYAPANSKNIVDNYGYIDLNEKDRLNRRFDYYWKVDQDPKILNDIYNNDWRTVSYISPSTQMLTDVSDQGVLKITSSAINNSILIQEYKNSGWEVQVREVTKQK